LAILGDSILSGATFTSALRAGLPRYSVDNFSVVGAGSAAIYNTLVSQILHNGYNEVILMAGMNDLDKTEAYVLGYIERMVKAAKTAGMRVVVVSITPYAANPHMIRTINARLKWYSIFWGADAYVNVWSLLADTDGGLLTEYSGDAMGLHPNTEGQRVMARKILRDAY
jgi:lysophospholipase L1-like esterase